MYFFKKQQFFRFYDWFEQFILIIPVEEKRSTFSKKSATTQSGGGGFEKISTLYSGSVVEGHEAVKFIGVFAGLLAGVVLPAVKVIY